MSVTQLSFFGEVLHRTYAVYSYFLIASVVGSTAIHNGKAVLVLLHHVVS
jgi:hypothetical protein